MSSMFRRPSGPFEPPTPLYHLISRPLHFLVYYAHHLINLFRGPPTKPRVPIRIVCLSDTHTRTIDDVPLGDVLIHAGDMGVVGTAAEIQAQIDWLASLPHPHKIVICGNHDGFLDPRSRKVLNEEGKSVDWKGITYLQHTSTEIRVQLQRPLSSSSSSASISSTHSAGSSSSRTPLLSTTRTLKIYGAPQIPACGGLDNAFQYQRGQDAWSGTVPDDVDILITHTPARWHRDLPWGQGCEHLLRELWRVQPRLHVCGHIHGGRGVEHLFWDDAELAYQNVCERAQGWGALFRPTVWLRFVGVLAHGAVGLLWNRGFGGRSEGCTVVNAALVNWNATKVVHKPIVVEI